MKDSPEFQKQFAGKKPDEIAKDPTFNQTVIDTYLKEAAKLGDKAAFMGEFLPTETGDTGAALGKVWEHAKTGDPGALRDMQATKTVSQIRLGNAQIADQFQQSDGGKGKEMFSLVVPYSNTVENIINNDGKPKDGADQFAKYMNDCAARQNRCKVRSLQRRGNGAGSRRRAYSLSEASSSAASSITDSLGRR